MKYRKIYEALERRWRVSPGFRFTDFSGWRNPRNPGHRHPLWIVVEDRASNRRFWITQEGAHLEIAYRRMGANGKSVGEAHCVFCSSQTQMARELERLFALPAQAA